MQARQGTQCGAVERRAAAVQGDYEGHARRIDARHSPAGQTPVAQRLRELGDIRGLVFGQYAEASADVHGLLSAAADGMAERWWRLYGARTQAEARSVFIARLRRQLGVFVAREMARHRLRRVPYVGVPQAVIARGLAGEGAEPGAGPVALRRARDGFHAADFFAHQAYVAPPPGVGA